MTKTIKQLKRYARDAFELKAGMVIGASLTVFMIQIAASMLASVLFPGDDILNIILGEIFAFGLTVLTCIFQAGMYYMYLCLSRGKESFYGQLLWFFKNGSDRVILASTVLALISWITCLPSTIYSYTAQEPTTQEELLHYYMVSFALLMAGFIVDTLITIPFRLTYYILADDENIMSRAVLKKSCSMMKGHIGKFILLQLSFFPWFFISVFTFYIPMLYVLPYMELADVAFYRDLNGEYIFYHPPAVSEQEDVIE